MEKEVKIVPPEGYTVDEENSTFDCIKFKLIERWRDSNPDITGWYVRNNSIGGKFILFSWKDGELDIFATEKQAKSALAMAQISQIMDNDGRFGGVMTDEEWRDTKVDKYVILRDNRGVISDSRATFTYSFLAFHTEEQRDLFLKENEDLVKDYLMID